MSLFAKLGTLTRYTIRGVTGVVQWAGLQNMWWKPATAGWSATMIPQAPWSPTAHAFAHHQFSHITIFFWKQGRQASLRLKALLDEPHIPTSPSLWSRTASLPCSLLIQLTLNSFHQLPQTTFLLNVTRSPSTSSPMWQTSGKGVDKQVFALSHSPEVKQSWTSLSSSPRPPKWSLPHPMFKLPSALYSGTVKVRNCGLGPHADQTAEMVRN